MNTNRAMGIIFANMHDDAVAELTAVRSMAALPFGSRYRMIDFALSSLVNANVTKVAVIARRNYHSLMDHLGTGRAYDLSRKISGISLFPPYSEADSSKSIYHGKIGALREVVVYLKKSYPPYVIMMDCDHVHAIDFNEMLDKHIESQADISVISRVFGKNDTASSDTLILKQDENGRVNEVAFEPNPEEGSFASMGIFIMSRELLISIIEEATIEMRSYFESDVLPKKLSTLNVKNIAYDGYSNSIASIKGYFRASMDLLNFDNLSKLFDRSRPVFTKVRDEAPVRYGVGSKSNNNLVADGCVIEGQVENSVLFRGVYVEKGAVVKDSILMQDSVIRKGVKVEHVITDKGVEITENSDLKGNINYPIYIKKNSVV